MIISKHLDGTLMLHVMGTSEDSTFDYWLKISTLELRKLLIVPVKLADYHRKTLERKTLNSSVTLNKRDDGWWLTLSYDEVVTMHIAPDAPVVGIDVGIANFVTTSTGKHYGTFHGKLRERQKRDRGKRRARQSCASALRKRASRNCHQPQAEAGSVLPGMCARK